MTNPKDTMASPSLSPTRIVVAFGAVLLISITSTAFGTASDPVIEVSVVERWRDPPPLPMLADIGAFERAALPVKPPTVPRALERCIAAEHARPPCTSAPEGACITPGRASAVRQSVPVRTRRKVRVWERAAAA